MSNNYRINPEAGTTVLEEPEKKAPVLSDAERMLAREKLLRSAMNTLYEKKGGPALEVELRFCEQTLANAEKCRLSEARRLEKDPDAMREKGERPLVTVSEGRMYLRESKRLRQEIADLRLICLGIIQEALNRNRPRDDEEYKHVIDAAVEDIDGIGRLARLEPKESANTEPPHARRYVEAVLKVGERMSREHRQQLHRAVREMDFDGIEALLRAQRPDLQQLFVALLNA